VRLITKHIVFVGGNKWMFIAPTINRIRQQLNRFGLGPHLLGHQRLHPSHTCLPLAGTSYLRVETSRHRRLFANNCRRSHTCPRRPAYYPPVYSSAPTSELSASLSQSRPPTPRPMFQLLHFHSHSPLAVFPVSKTISWRRQRVSWPPLSRPLELA